MAARAQGSVGGDEGPRPQRAVRRGRGGGDKAPGVRGDALRGQAGVGRPGAVHGGRWMPGDTQGPARWPGRVGPEQRDHGGLGTPPHPRWPRPPRRLPGPLWSPLLAAVRAAAVPMSPPQPRSAPPAPPAGTRARADAAQGHRQARPGCPPAAGGKRSARHRTSTPTRTTWPPAPQGARVGDRARHVRSCSHGGRWSWSPQLQRGRDGDGGGGGCVVQVRSAGAEEGDGEGVS